MGPFHHRFSERNDHDKPYQQEPNFHLRSTYEEEQKPSSFDPSSAPRMSTKEGQTIRNLGFFKEQERQFTQGEEEEEWQERQSPLNFILIIGIFVALCGTGWLGYQWARQSTNHTPPLITADPTPFKVRPENPGGMVIPHQDKLVYGRLSPSSSPQVEHLLPPPEQLITPPPSLPPSTSDNLPPQPQTFVDANGQVYYAYPAPLPPSSAGAPLPPAQPIPSSAPPLPVQTAPSLPGHPLPPPAAAPVAPQQGYDPFPTAVPATGSIDPRTTSPAPPAVEQAPHLAPPTPHALPAEATPSYETPTPIHPSSSSTQVTGESTRPSLPPPLPPMPAASPAEAPATLDQLIEQEMGPQELRENSFTTKAKAPINAYKLQVATLDSLEAARKEALRIKNIDPTLFKDKKLTTQAIKTGNTKTYRVLIEGFNTPNAAAQFSSKLRAHKVKGIVLHQPS